MAIQAKNRTGLTIIELIVVIGVIAVSIPTIFGLFFTMLRARAKTYVLQAVKHNGDEALTTMTSRIRQDAVAIYTDSNLNDDDEVCSVTSGINTPSSYTPNIGGFIYFKDQNGDEFAFIKMTGNTFIAFERMIDNIVVLNHTLTDPNKLNVTNFSMSCYRTSDFSPPVITISFQISNNTSVTRQEERATLFFNTKVKLRD